MKLLAPLHAFERGRPFTEDEAWFLFKVGAIGEACGWSMLISGITLRALLHNQDPVLIAGQLHGVLFLLYALAALGLYPSLGWSRKRALVATIASVPPYGSIVFEQWAAYKRSRASFKTYRTVLLWKTVTEQL